MLFDKQVGMPLMDDKPGEPCASETGCVGSLQNPAPFLQFLDLCIFGYDRLDRAPSRSGREAIVEEPRQPAQDHRRRSDHTT